MGLGGLTLNPKVPEAYNVETVKLGYIPVKEDDKMKQIVGDNKTEFPLYSSSTREKVICELKCNTIDQKEKLFISGICFYLE